MVKQLYVITLNGKPYQGDPYCTGVTAPVRYGSREDAWEAAVNGVAEELIAAEIHEDCRCEEGSAEPCDRCGLEGAVGAFRADGYDPSRPDEFFTLIGTDGARYVFMVEPAEHYHLETGGRSMDFSDLEDVLQAASIECGHAAEAAEHDADANGNVGDQFGALGSRSTRDEYHAMAYRCIRLMDGLATAAANLDMASRRNAPLFQGPHGPKKLHGTMEHLLDTNAHIPAGCGTVIHMWACSDERCHGEGDGDDGDE